MLCEGSLWNMGYSEHMQQTKRTVDLPELTSDHEHTKDQNVHFYKPQGTQVYTHWLDHSEPSESHHPKRRKITLAQIFMKFQKPEWRA